MTNENSFEQQDHWIDGGIVNRSKSAKKRDMLELQSLGEELACLPDRQFKKITFDDMSSLREAIEFFRKLPPRKFEARRRQMQFIGKIIRQVDTDSLALQLQQVKTLKSNEKRISRQAEQWRKLLLEDPQNLTKFLDIYPGDAQKLNQLIRAARKAKTINKDQGEARKLFRTIHEMVSH